VRLLDQLVVGGCDDEPLRRQRNEALVADVFDVALAAVQRLDDVRLHVHQEYALPGFAKGCRERHADIAGADDCDVVDGRLGHGGQGYSAAAMRPAACPSP